MMPTSSKRLLIVAHDFPFPPKHGGRVDMWRRIKVLKQLGIGVDLIASVKEQPGESETREVQNYVHRLIMAGRQMGKRQQFSFRPFSVRSRCNLRELKLAETYDAVILEGEHVAEILENPTLRAGRSILRVHNNEAQYYRELSQSSHPLWRKAFYLLESMRFRLYSPQVMRRCDSLWFISDFERREYAHHNPQSAVKALFVPPPVAVTCMKRHTLAGATVLFSGRLGFATNARGAEWYVQRVHPLLSDIDGYQLLIAGSTEGEPLDALRQAAGRCPNVVLQENPSSLRPYYERACVFINPVFQGAGLKIKTIDALQAGLPVVSTPVGIQGSGLLDGKHVLVAHTAQGFADCVRRLLNDRGFAESLVAEAQAFIAREYDHERILKGFFGGEIWIN